MFITRSFGRSMASGVVVAGLMVVASTLMADDPVRFSQDVRPILSDACFQCHGPDEEHREAGLRLDTAAGMLDESEVVVPGDLENSELYRRIMSDDPDEVMPPPSAVRQLTDAERDTIRRWIEQGAAVQQHWAFVPPTRPEPPPVQFQAWPVNEIDRFVLRKLEDLGARPNPPAERDILIRRVALDLTGLPPDPELWSRYRQDTSPDWYERLVDELIATPQYGEHMARYWLDAARYGDTHGLHLDNYREFWLYRDWVIDAMNRNMPFDQFTIEQLAGDLLPNPTDEQLIATGFNRAHVTTAEGGSIKEEVHVRNVVDRVNTTGTVFMGLTIGCVQCHDHKYDPITQREYYQLFAFFNSLDADPMDGNAKAHPPVLRKYRPEDRQREAELNKRIADLKQRIETTLADFEYTDPAASAEPVSTRFESPEEFVWVDDDLPPGAKQQQRWEFVSAADGHPVHSGQSSRLQQVGDGMVQHFFTESSVPLRVEPDDQLFAWIWIDPDHPPAEIMLQFNDGTWEHRARWGENRIDWGQDGTGSRRNMGDMPTAGEWIRLEVTAREVGFNKPALINGMAFTQWGGRAFWDEAGVVSHLRQNIGLNSLSGWIELQTGRKGEGLPGPVSERFRRPVSEWKDEDREVVLRYFLENVNPESRKLVAPLKTELSSAQEDRKKLVDGLPTTLIWKELAKPKPAHILKRGDYDKPGEEVTRDIPALFGPWPEELPRDRLGLAQWLVSGHHPLTARVTVNRFWQQVFGTGIVKTSEDFGSQGEMPSHPELLDWLAVDFVDSGWDVKRLMKMIVMSATYRQSSRRNPTLDRADPENRFLSRGPRYRLDAEVLRDQALAVSGLLVRTIGGPSVKPPQPDGLWFAVGYSDSNTVRFRKDEGHEKVHRRSMYTFWKRTAPPPQMNTFDAPSRESCTVRRERTNTPLQALLLMNDPQYVEAARYLAQRVVDGRSGDEQRARYLLELALSREPDDATVQIILQQVVEDRADFTRRPDDAAKLIAIGEQPASDQYDSVELATWTMAANLVMNMDEFICKN